MRTASAAALAVVAAASLACSTSRGLAQRSPDRIGDGAGPPALETNAGTIEGVVSEVDRGEGTVSIAAGDTVRTVLLAADGAVLIDDFRAGFEDVKEGQAVRAALHDAGSGVEAVRIQILHQAVPVAPAEGSEAAPR